MPDACAVFRMSELIPSLGELRSALVEDSYGAQVADAFDCNDLKAARSALASLVICWEQTSQSEADQ